MFTDLNLYECVADKLFETKIMDSITDLFGEEVDTIVNQGYFVISKNVLDIKKSFFCISAHCHVKFNISEAEYKLIDNEFLKSKNLLLGKQLFDAKNKTKIECKEKLDKFRENLLECQYKWLYDYTQHVLMFLANRYSEGKKIIQHDAVRLSWARLIEHQETLRQCLDELNDNFVLTKNDVYVLAPRIIREWCKILARLFGARAFLSQQSVEKLYVFEIFNKIYLMQPV